MLTPVGGDLPQQQVNAYFQSSSDYWKRIYETRTLMPLIYQTRHAAVVNWIVELGLPISSRILEIGCGAGVLTAQLARLGYSVEAVDAAPAMVELTLQNAIDSGLADRVQASLADVHELPFQEERFDLVIAIGVIPWLHDEDLALLEMQRVLKPGGHLIVTADNDWRLNRILDPLSSPVSRPARSILKFILRRAGLRTEPREFQPKRHTPSEINHLLEVSGFRKVNSKCVGFGPFTFFRRHVFPEKLGTAVHIRLQSLADDGVPPFHMTGLHYLALVAKK
jgi:ubiquinone/menaquinone biosynthesis C-methylase UbiE